MPRMDGLTFLRKVMAEDPIPTVIFRDLPLAGQRPLCVRWMKARSESLQSRSSDSAIFFMSPVLFLRTW